MGSWSEKKKGLEPKDEGGLEARKCHEILTQSSIRKKAQAIP
jgi:hypothetical protein